MFKVGELIIYSAHGICQIDDICEKTYNGITKKYYVLHPLDNLKLSISTPVNNKAVNMLELLDRNEAKILLNSFHSPGIEWIENNKERTKVYSDIINSGNRKELSKVVNTLLRKKVELELDNKKLLDQDLKLLISVQNILYRELAYSLNTSFESIMEEISNSVHAEVSATV
ncbi:transcriptional regulator, CarD family [Psychrobacillus sp. OK028]|uniref:CarD family transcriptional regulator n=1 Tax=Psychrobacillus sp. OK028 TaxID=1884359 RepID=UPI000888EE7B|nr:CarD family transcriptional regulator [Psychrobacillus sp. OK028]SDN72713.1 transcriptional regulator, CarD family [Psychrobacillus sp. OK028]